MHNRIFWCWLSCALALLVAVTATATESSPVQSGYRIGPNDVIRIQVFGEEDLTVESRVGGDGKLNYPLLGVLQVGGQTTEALQAELTKRLADGYVRMPKVSVSIVRHRNVYVTGEVKAPGGFPFEDGLTAQKAITMAGGFTEKAAKAVLSITRRTANQEGTLSAQLDTALLPDDLIVVGQLQKFYLMGEVTRQEEWARARGFTCIQFKTRNRLKAMLQFALGNGFDIIGVEPRETLAEYRILLQKSL